MKSFKKIIPAIAMLALSAILATSTTYAWFSMNQKAVANNMAVVAAVNGSLVISDNVADLTAGKYKSSIDFVDQINENDVVNLIDCTHIENSETDKWTSSGENNYPNGLKTLNTAGRKLISTSTGLTAESLNSYYVSATNVVADEEAGTEAITYYFDYVVYLASQGMSLADQMLKIKLEAISDNSEGENPFVNATAIDFFVIEKNASNSFDDPSASNYKGTKWVGGFGNDAVAIIGGDEENENDKITIPKADGESAIKVVMRVYLDGAKDNDLSENALKAYLNSDEYSAKPTKFKVTFEVDDKPVPAEEP